jgi:hypothetical protein
MQYVFGEWSVVLWGKGDSIPTPVSPESEPFDVLATGTRPTTEKHILTDRKVGWGGILKWGLRYEVDILVRA